MDLNFFENTKKSWYKTRTLKWFRFFFFLLVLYNAFTYPSLSLIWNEFLLTSTGLISDHWWTLTFPFFSFLSILKSWFDIHLHSKIRGITTLLKLISELCHLSRCLSAKSFWLSVLSTMSDYCWMKSFQVDYLIKKGSYLLFLSVFCRWILNSCELVV